MLELKLLAALLLVATLVKDWRTYVIEYRHALPLIIVSSCISWYSGEFLANIVVTIVLGGMVWLLSWAKIGRREIMGSHDYLIVATLALLFGWRALLVMWQGAMLLVGVHLILVSCKQRGWRDQIPFAAYMSLVAILHLFS